MARFPDVERVLKELLNGMATGGAGIETPANLQDRLPFIRIRNLGGPNDGITTYPTVDIDVFSSTRDTGYGLAEDIHQLLLTQHNRTASGQIDFVETEVSPVEMPWADDNVRRFFATYRLSLRR